MTRIYYMGKRVRENNGRFSSFKIKAKIFLGKVFRLSMLGLALYVAFISGRYIAPTETIVNVVQADSGIPPVLERIAKCESGGKHFDKNGQVLMRSNTNKSVDVGKFQINSIWFAKATEMGLDITKEADNEKMAEWIYENKGTSDWSASFKCWSR